MRILMLSWEYPPKVVGGLARAVADLSEALASQGHEVRVITSYYPGCKPLETQNDVQVYRVNNDNPNPVNFLDSVMYFNFNLIQKAVELENFGWQWDVVHAHDWLVAHAGKVLKHTSKQPLVATIHATEWGRNGGLHNELQRHISDIEWWLAYEAYAVICCSNYMCEELKRIFQVPQDKLHMIPNGVKLANFIESHSDLDRFRSTYVESHENMVFFVGRLVYEKGIQVLLDAVPKILQRCPNTKFIIAGKGPMQNELQSKVQKMGLGNYVQFTGFIDDLTRNSLYRTANVAVFPSLYEPFGIVALEAMAAKTALVVSDIGGFSEIVTHGKNGLTSYAGNSQSLADNIVTLLLAPDYTSRLCQEGYYDVLNKYNWDEIAKRTADLYYRMSKNNTYVGTRQLASELGKSIPAGRYQQTCEYEIEGGQLT